MNLLLILCCAPEMLLNILNGERTEGFKITILRFKITNTLTKIIHYGDFNSTNPAFLIIL